MDLLTLLFHSYAMLFAMLYQFHHIIPAASRFPLFGTTVSDKIYVYLAAAQVRMKSTRKEITLIMPADDASQHVYCHTMHLWINERLTLCIQRW